MPRFSTLLRSSTCFTQHHVLRRCFAPLLPQPFFNSRSKGQVQKIASFAIKWEISGLSLLYEIFLFSSSHVSLFPWFYKFCFDIHASPYEDDLSVYFLVL
jgi:hypothetical protein